MSRNKRSNLSEINRIREKIENHTVIIPSDVKVALTGTCLFLKTYKVTYFDTPNSVNFITDESISCVQYVYSGSYKEAEDEFQRQYGNNLKIEKIELALDRSLNFNNRAYEVSILPYIPICLSVDKS